MARSRELFDGAVRLRVNLEKIVNSMSMWDENGELVELDADIMDNEAILEGVAGAIRDWVGTVALMDSGLDNILGVKK